MVVENKEKHSVINKGENKKGDGFVYKQMNMADVLTYGKLHVGSKHSTKHPAIFPEQLAQDHVLSWSNENDLVYDCFMGSGTTAKMSILNNRNYIGSEISKEYCDIIHSRLMNKPKDKQINIFDQIEEQKETK